MIWCWKGIQSWQKQLVSSCYAHEVVLLSMFIHVLEVQTTQTVLLLENFLIQQ
jgi:hypothetical protein